MPGKSAVEVFFDRLADPRLRCETGTRRRSPYAFPISAGSSFYGPSLFRLWTFGVYTRGRQAQASQRPQGRFLVRTLRLITSRLQTVLKRPSLLGSFHAGGLLVTSLANVNEAPESPRFRAILSPGGDPRPLLAPALHRRGNAHAFPILGDRAPGDVDAAFPQHVHKRTHPKARPPASRRQSFPGCGRARLPRECASPPPEEAIEAVKK